MLHHITLPLLAILTLSLLNFVRGDNLFIGCGDGLNEVELTFQVHRPDFCYNICKERSYTYYTHKPNKDCVCYKYPPPAAEHMPGGPGRCNGQMQYNLIRSNWNFQKCYTSPPKGLIEIPSDSFKACLESCKPYEIAIARPTEIYPGQTNCICTSANKLVGLKEVMCDYNKYYVYRHTPNARRDSRSIAIAERHLGLEQVEDAQ
ncbi:hypothetical protein I302_107379 [Kwoniella bestiolae CBS 10118]|uniref:WSC domain-containing protein n=1 Tax=Kwoniella bestiolae CBS 10118 TaxID=1296100 RepID=A0A1B9FYP9_9TREE|nr:hypothetical protein I302_06883 [Kwoniella bestiolae CBS 10118]OCF23897.1 hypothetical protein I302_06883 [Kwoniella bestiolae CBS 10118]